MRKNPRKPVYPGFPSLFMVCKLYIRLVVSSAALWMRNIRADGLKQG